MQNERREAVKIGMCTGESRIDDSSFLFSAWNGLRKVRELLQVKTSIIESQKDEDGLEHLLYLAQEGYGLILAVGFYMNEQLVDAACRYPGNIFCGIDTTVEYQPSNLVTVHFREQEGSFLAGYAAAKTSRTGKIGFLGGQNVPLIRKFLDGYTAGADYSDPGVVVETRYADSFLSYSTGQMVGKEMYDAGCDVIYHAAGTVGKGLIRTAKEVGQLVIGVDIDQSFLAPENVLTSMIKNVQEAVVRIAKDFLDGTIEHTKTIEYGLKDGLIDLAPITLTRAPDGLAEEIADIKSKIIAGEIIVPSR
jgi:basic membrane protein A and related proteins